VRTRRLKEAGQALLIALAFTSLAVPIATGILSLASTLTLDSVSRADRLKAHYSALGAQQIATYVLRTTTTDPTSTEIVIDISGGPVTTTIARLPTLPRDIPFTSRSKLKFLTVKTASPTNVAENGTTTYSITIQNVHKKSMKLTKVVDELPDDFIQVPGSTVMKDSDGDVISVADAILNKGNLDFDVPGDPKLEVGETYTLEFVAQAPSIPGIYCNDVYAEKRRQEDQVGSYGKSDRRRYHRYSM
jgi:uncharacterized repeat protein (TIGR01451 family)